MAHQQYYEQLNLAIHAPCNINFLSARLALDVGEVHALMNQWLTPGEAKLLNYEVCRVNEAFVRELYSRLYNPLEF